jgi:hypothetical protein
MVGIFDGRAACRFTDSGMTSPHAGCEVQPFVPKDSLFG